MAITPTNVPRFSKLDFWNGGSPGWDTTGLRSWAWWVAAESWWPNWRTSNKSAADQTFRAMEDDQHESQSPPWSLLCHIVSSSHLPLRLAFWFLLMFIGGQATFSDTCKLSSHSHWNCQLGLAETLFQMCPFLPDRNRQPRKWRRFGRSRKVAALEMAFWQGK